jgi:CRISPR-associated protein Cmr2
MGKAIDKISQGADAAERHRRFSKKLAEFAGKARCIVEQRHLGSLVYSGGDDVLAFLPLPTALECAEKLRYAFAGLMKDACPGFEEAQLPTLSVGLGIGHVLESMSDLLNLGRAAEKLAKGGHLRTDRRRNALAVIVDKRSGGTRQWRARWNNPQFAAGPAERLRFDASLLRSTLSTRKVFEIADTLRRFPKPTDAIEPVWADMLASEVRRSLERMDAGTNAPRLDSATLRGQLGLDVARTALPNETPYKARHEMVADWIDRLLIAKTFAEADPTPRKTATAATPSIPSSATAGTVVGRAP